MNFLPAQKHWIYLGKAMYRSEVSLVQPGKSTDRPAGRRQNNASRIMQIANAVSFFFLAVGFIGLKCSAMCPRRRISYARACVRLSVACVHLVNCSARVNGVRSALRCSSTANSSERITEPSRTSSASRTAVAAPKNNTAATMCPM